MIGSARVNGVRVCKFEIQEPSLLSKAIGFWSDKVVPVLLLAASYLCFAIALGGILS